ncbi:oxidoreductase [Colletotrichum truncatum]|uniref:Oxidoreductase n=1 Tax=Colletotrichum truncatum TaxID=5467 RepID=A0ACC3YPZ9_COLTU|nr:oxidoreductase [Colletotrichum truncatum]KAF6796807.1 oxidoreductase [Colletotrichum truncatum]
MSTSVLFIASLLGAAQAYTVISAPGPFMLKNIDPIVYPGQHNKSHLHSFFGSDAVTVDTKTSAELQKGCTNLENPNDLSVYWIPTPLFTTNGGKTYEPIPVARFSAYYNLGESPAEVAIPQDLKMVSGNADAVTQAQVPKDSKAEWFCEGGGGGALDANGFPSQTCGTHLQQLLYFPSCVNTETLETAYKSRTYGTQNWCPKGMKSMPQLRFSIRYNLRKVLPNGWSGSAPFKLSCGPAWCSHGDFINGWTKESAQNMVPTTSDKRAFFGVNGALGNYKDYAKCKAVDADPAHGTSNYAESVAVMSKREVDSFGWQSKSRFARST